MAQTTEGASVHPNDLSAKQETVSRRKEGADPEIVQVNTVHFGCFNDRIQIEVQNLQTGLSTLDDAISELTRQFRKYRKIVSTVGDRYGDDETLMRKIDLLETEKNAIWKQAQNDRDSYKKDMAGAEVQHAEQMLELQAKAEAGSQKKVEYEQKIKDLVEQHTRTEQKQEQEFQQKIQDLEKEHRQKKDQLEKDNEQKIANLEKDRNELEETKARLSKELHDRRSERDQERELRIMVQEKTQKDITELQGELTSINKHTEEYKKIFERVHQIVYERLTDLPEKALKRPADTSEKLCQQNRIFEQIPIGESECSMMLRRAAAEHIIIKFICDTLWRPFFSEYLVSSEVNDSVLPKMYAGMAEAGKDFQHRWKVATLKTLDNLDKTNMPNGQHKIGKIVDQQIIGPLRYLLDDSQALLSDLNQIFCQAIELGKAAERDQMNIILDVTPYLSAQNSGGWIEWLGEDYESDYGSDESPSSPTSTFTAASLVVRTEPLLISPKILRQAETNGPMELVLPGRAIFPERGIFQDGALQWQTIHHASSQAARAKNGSNRRQSTATAGLGMSLHSPIQTPNLWSASSVFEQRE
ncbi:uncharacterized protein A1O9_10374 [Exophiala aquamarina CBS 119918]|uniref:Uncharacterized protein n=1 Tax=Exophiala aquamarina CBS 119918 TaxID=1182545 RepID=A0A072NZW4_9EURO|nr:uncharacterized protein A1O9_10374 [Exophiala aquamarina CBS 119918]KEF53399.1 hypothetical protein A1O9_10374 [Exophiala aquamarina CBS 119918]